MILRMNAKNAAVEINRSAVAYDEVYSKIPVLSMRRKMIGRPYKNR